MREEEIKVDNAIDTQIKYKVNVSKCQQKSTKKGDIDADKYPDPTYPAYRLLLAAVVEKHRTGSFPEV